MIKVRDRFQFKVNTGITSIFMIFIVLCLTAFGVLSYSAATADLKLSKKNVENIESYYNAESKMVELISHIDDYLLDVSKESLNADAYFESISNGIVSVEKDSKIKVSYDAKAKEYSAEYEIDDKKTLVMLLEIKSPDEEHRFEMKSLKVNSQIGSYSGEPLPF